MISRLTAGVYIAAAGGAGLIDNRRRRPGELLDQQLSHRLLLHVGSR